MSPLGDVNRMETLASAPQSAQPIFALDGIIVPANLLALSKWPQVIDIFKKRKKGVTRLVRP